MKSRWKRILLWALGVIGALLVTLVLIVEIRSRGRFAAPAPNVHASTDPAVIARGEYIVHHVAHCSACHIPGRMQIAGRPAMIGGHTWALPFGTFRSANITPDRETGIGAWTDAELARAIRHGVGRNGNLLPLMALALGSLSEQDMIAVISYLRAQPPVRNAVPAESLSFMGRALYAFGVFFPARIGERLPTDVPAGEAPTVERGRFLAENGAVYRTCQWDPLESTCRHASLSIL